MSSTHIGRITLPNGRSLSRMAYKAPVRDTCFIINEVLRLESYNNLPGFEDVSADIVSVVVERSPSPSFTV